MNKSDLISIVIPVYNEEGNISLIYKRITEVFKKSLAGYDYEIIFVNDGSEDKSGAIINELLIADKKVRYIEFSRNFGKEIATSAGINHSKGDAVIMLDGDLQHPPELIPEFIKKWKNGADVIVGIRDKNNKEGFVKKYGSIWFYKIMNAIGDTKLVPRATDYRLIDKKVVAEFNRFTERNRMTRGLINWLGFKRDYVHFNAGERNSGKAGYGCWKLFRLALSAFTSYSLFPLKFAGYLGVFITFFSGILGLFIFIEKYVFNDSLDIGFSGSAILAVIVMFLIGIVLACLGLIALYIANIHGEVLNRPIYIISEKKNID